MSTDDHVPEVVGTRLTLGTALHAQGKGRAESEVLEQARRVVEAGRLPDELSTELRAELERLLVDITN